MLVRGLNGGLGVLRVIDFTKLIRCICNYLMHLCRVNVLHYRMCWLG